MKPVETYRITAVRLVEFHNLGTTTVEIPDGGHLFLLGDNGSGKTTLLDAIHLVLSGKRDMELNSAARVAGAKDVGGRTIQGIVLRYNAVTGRVARESGITYAAVELKSSAGKVLSLAIGLSAEGLDVAYQSWGGMASVPVGELPLTVEEGGRLRARTQTEFRQGMTGGLVGGKYFAHISDYRAAVATRLFGGASKYDDACKLLRTGKAYREIAARATNYDDLFRQLLEDPQRETFEPLLKGLRELEESKGRLSQIDERAQYLFDLRRRRDQLGLARAKTSVLAWAEAVATRTRAATEFQQLTAARTAGLEEEKALAESAHVARAEIDRARERLEALKAKDATGLLGREKVLAARAAESQRRADAEAENLAEETARVRKAQKLHAQFVRAYDKTRQQAGEAIQKTSRAAELPLGELTDALFAASTEAEFPDDCTAVFASVRAPIAAARDARAARAYDARRRAAETAEATAAAEAACADLRSRAENMPHIAGFAEMQRTLRQNMLRARCVYELLEPAPGCDGRHLALLERWAGEDFLATVVAEEQEADRVRQLVWREEAPFAVAMREDCSGDVTTLTPWLGNYISFEASDPAAVRLLARHLATGGAPQEGDFLSFRTWSFRDRAALFAKDRPRLIGRKARAAELARQMREAEERLAACQREQKVAERLAQQAETAERAVRQLEDEVTAAEREVRRAVASVQQARAQWTSAEQMRVRTQALAEERAQEAAVARDELEDVRLRMRAEGIDATLEKRLSSAEKSLRQKEETAQAVQQKIGAVRGRLEALEKSCATREAEVASATARVASAAAAFADLLAAGETVEAGAARICPASVGATDFAALREQCVGDARVAETEIKRMIREQKGEAFSFSFDAQANRLADRRGSELDEVLADETRRLEELKGVLNQKSREVFERIFMGEVMQRLYLDLKQLEDLAQRIQRKLAGRRFGSNRYAFALTPVPTYEGFVNLVRKGYLLDAGEGKDDLHAYLEEHREEILSAEVDQIPEIFDYRRWFRFQLKVLTENEEGRVIDRQVKSLGSGGEQAVPNYLLILTVAEFLYHGGESNDAPKCAPLLFDEAFYGIDAARRDQLLAFADDLGLQLFVSSPDQDGVKREIRHSVSLIVIKDENLDVHLSPILWNNVATQGTFLETASGPAPSMQVLDETK